MAKAFRADAVILGEGADAVSLLQGAADPSAGGGVPAALGSLYFQLVTSSLWQKTGAGDTDWDVFT